MKLGAPSPLGAARGAFYAFLLGMALYTYRIAVDETASLRRELQQREDDDGCVTAAAHEALAARVAELEGAEAGRRERLMAEVRREIAAAMRAGDAPQGDDEMAELQRRVGALEEAAAEKIEGLDTPLPPAAGARHRKQARCSPHPCCNLPPRCQSATSRPNE